MSIVDFKQKLPNIHNQYADHKIRVGGNSYAKNKDRKFVRNQNIILISAIRMSQIMQVHIFSVSVEQSAVFTVPTYLQ